MAADLLPIGNQVAHRATIEDQVRIAFAPAKPTTDALSKLLPARNWLAEQQKRERYERYLLLDLENHYPCELLDEAKARLVTVPEMTVLENAKRLFHDAENTPAPWGWYALAFNAMLAAAPNTKNVAPAYVFGLIDAFQHDEELWEGYRPGFSCAVVVVALRQLRRDTNFIPTPAEVFQACLRHRRRFRDLQWTTDTLLQVRQNAEEVVAEDAAETERQQRWDAGWRPKGWTEADENENLPF